jgi:hypothetical protein
MTESTISPSQALRVWPLCMTGRKGGGWGGRMREEQECHITHITPLSECKSRSDGDLIDLASTVRAARLNKNVKIYFQ